MPRRPFNQACSIARTLEIVGERWSLLVLRDMWVRGPRRFDQLQRNLTVARNILTDRLDTLIEGGVVERRLYQTKPDRYEYYLSEIGAELVPVLLSLVKWGDRHLAGKEGPPSLFRHKGHDHFADPVTVCRVCGDELTINELEPLPGPGAPKRPARKPAAARRSA
ncbi:MAG TPA: helix-turn-helix domain-containing protein [Acidimicrobiia bacterium]|jgi:DNA-binding HxlR family transcriptional regulator